MKKYKVMKEYFAVIKQLKELREFFGNECYVCVGGSYSLTYLLDTFNREVSDYDFVVTGNLEVARRKMENMVAIGAARRCAYYNSNAFYMGTCFGKKCNILVTKHVSTSFVDSSFNNPWSVAEAKHQYIREALAVCAPPRTKDMSDLICIYKETDLYSDTLSLNAKHFRTITRLANCCGLRKRSVTEVIRDLANIAVRL